jgi:hypothetical protein
MSLNNEIEKQRREEMRWQILLTLYHNRPNNTRETWIMGVLDNTELYPGVSELRQELHYLEGKKLISTYQHGSAFGSNWTASLSAEGVDYVEYVSGAIAGIARPQRY